MNHVAFHVPVATFEDYRQRLIEKGVEVSPILNHDDSKYGVARDMHEGVFVRSFYFQDPDVFRHAVRGFALYRNSALDPVLRELGQCRAGWARGSQFVFSQHCKQMRALGLTEERIASIPHWQTADCYSPLERAVLACTDGLVLDGGRVPDGVRRPA